MADQERADKEQEDSVDPMQRAHDKENKKLWQKYMDRGNESRRLYAIYLKEAKEENEWTTHKDEEDKETEEDKEDNEEEEEEQYKEEATD